MEENDQQSSNIQDYVTPAKPHGEKVIQPSASLIEAMKTAQAAPPPAPPQPGSNPTAAQYPLQSSPTAGIPMAPQAPVTPPSPSSIYPEATRGINSNGAGNPAPSPVDETKDTEDTYTFAEGYSIGKTIFIYQLIAGLVLGFLSSRIYLTFYHFPIVLAIVYVVVYLLTLLFLPYYVLRTDAVKEPLWITLIGTAVQTIIVAIGFTLLTMLLKTEGSLGIFAIVIDIGFLIAGYFLTKLSWGVAFSLVEKIKNKVLIKAVGIGLIVLFVGYIAYHFVAQASDRVGSTTSNASTPAHQSTDLTRYQVNGNPSFSVDFYAGSKTTSGGNLTYSTGHAGQGVNFSISNAITINATSSCSSTGNNSEFNFQSQGSTGIVCISNSKSMTSYIGYIQVNGKSYVVNMFAFSYQQNLATVKAIFNSISINF